VVPPAAWSSFLASLSPRIKKLTAFDRTDGFAASVLGALLDIPAKPRHRVIA
jgi:hypothetical protein